MLVIHISHKSVCQVISHHPLHHPSLIIVYNEDKDLLDLGFRVLQIWLSYGYWTQTNSKWAIHLGNGYGKIPHRAQYLGKNLLPKMKIFPISSKSFLGVDDFLSWRTNWQKP